MSDILNKILAVKREEVAIAQATLPLALQRAQAQAQGPARDFLGAIRAKIASAKPAVIAEITAAGIWPALIPPRGMPGTSSRRRGGTGWRAAMNSPSPSAPGVRATAW